MAKVKTIVTAPRKAGRLHVGLVLVADKPFEAYLTRNLRYPSTGDKINCYMSGSSIYFDWRLPKPSLLQEAAGFFTRSLEEQVFNKENDDTFDWGNDLIMGTTTFRVGLCRHLTHLPLSVSWEDAVVLIDARFSKPDLIKCAFKAFNVAWGFWKAEAIKEAWKTPKEFDWKHSLPLPSAERFERSRAAGAKRRRVRPGEALPEAEKAALQGDLDAIARKLMEPSDDPPRKSVD